MAQIITNRIEVQSDYEGLSIKGFVEFEAGDMKRVHGSFLVDNNQIGNFDKANAGTLAVFLTDENSDKLSIVATNLPLFFQEIQEL